MLRRLTLALLVVAGCASEPAGPAAIRPRPPPTPMLPLPPWQARLSVAQGYEPSPKAPASVMIKNATILTATGKTIPRGTVVLANGKIAAVLDHEAPASPGVEVVDGTGKFVTPGIIDTHSHLGVYPWPSVTAHDDGNEMTDPVFPQAQSVDAFWPQDPGIERAVAGGVTAIQVLPGSGNLVGGRAVTIKLRAAQSAREMHFRNAPDGLKMACGENPKRRYGTDKRTPMSRMGNLALQRAAFLRAQKLSREWTKWRDAETHRQQTAAKKQAQYEAKRDERAQREAWCKTHADEAPARCADWRQAWAKETLDPPEPTEPLSPPDRDPGLETLVAAIEGRVLVHVHCYRADDMKAMIALSNEIGFKIRSFHHALEAYKIRDDLAQRGIAVSTWADWWGFKMEAYDGIPENAALVHEAGARAIIHSDSAEGIQRLNQEAAKALASGRRAGVAISEDDAIRWITLYPAWALGVDQATGSIEVGKDADVVLWSANPFSVRAFAEKVWIDGALRYSHGAAPWSDFEVGQDATALPSLKAPPQPAPAPAPPPAPAAPSKAAPGSVVAIVGATVHTGTGAPIEDGVVVIADGKIADVGKGIAPPAGAEVISAKGAVVTAGLVDALTSVGLVEVDLEKATHDDRQSGTDKIRAGFRAADGYNPASSVVGVTRADGITSVGVIPSGGLISGQSAWADLDGATAADALAAAPLALHVHLEGEADPEGGGHATAVLRVREAFDDARTFARTRAAWERNQSRKLAPSRLDLEALTAALDGKVPVVFHVDRAADILSALGVARELKLRPVIAGGAEAWKVAPALAAARVPVIVYPIVSDPITFDAVSARDDNAARLAAAGVPVVISTGETHNARKLRQVAGNAVRAGLPYEAALLSITRAPAEALGMGARYGTIAKGKVANVVIWSGDPLELSTDVKQVFVRGRKVPLGNRQSALRDKYRRLAP